MKVIVSPRAKKQIKKLSKTFQIIIVKKLLDIGKGTATRSEKLTGYKDIFRIRIGNYRIVYRKMKWGIYIVLVAHRKEAYLLAKKLLK